MEITLSLDKTPDAQDVQFVRERLNEFNRACLGFADEHKPLAVFLRDENGQVVGGLTGCTYWGWLCVDILWVDERLRGQGWGKKRPYFKIT